MSGPRPRFPRRVLAAGRSKKKPGGPSPGRIEGGADVRRRAKHAARKRSRRLAENLFYRHSKTLSDEADSFTDAELAMLGLGYDRTVRFMDRTDPRLRHPHDWFKYGRYGPYSWRGVVVGSPVRGRHSDDRVALYAESGGHEDFELADRHDLTVNFSPRAGSRYYWAFIRHPKWRPSDPPWSQWTLAAEVAVEAEPEEPVDKWSLMGRFGNGTRALISKCAAWARPDVIYVRRPVYQIRFEPQDEFFRLLVPLLDPGSERLFECRLRGEPCSYYAGLCRVVGVGSKAFVDEVVDGFDRLTDDGKDACLEFLLSNHPLELLHPYTKEWKVKLTGDDDDDYDNSIIDIGDNDDDDDDDNDDDGDDDDDNGDDDDDNADDEGEGEEYWKEQWEKAMREPEAMEGIVRKSIEVSNKVYEEQKLEREMEAEPPEVSPVVERSEYGGRRGRRRERVPPELFLRAAVRPFSYRNLVKEIVLLRHAILDKEVVSSMP